MNDTQMNWLRMYRKVKGVLADNSAITDTYPPIASSAATFSDLLGKIETVSTEGSKTTKGTYEDKIDKKEAMALEAVELASAALAFAKDTSNTALAAVLGISYSDIRYGDDQTSYNLAMTIHNELTELETELEDYLVTAEDLAGLKAAIDAYHALLENTGSQDSVAQTRQLAGLFKKANEHLKDNLDKLVTRIRRKEPVFYNTYTNARVILDLGTGKKQEPSTEMTL